MIDQARGRVVRRTVVSVPPATIFALLADPRQHPALDGTGSVRGMIDGPGRLELGSMFRMRMKGYTTTNTVVEFEPDTLIAWRHRGRRVWRWRLRAVTGGTEMTETFDHSAKRVRRIGVPRRAGVALNRSPVALRARFA